MTTDGDTSVHDPDPQRLRERRHRRRRITRRPPTVGNGNRHPFTSGAVNVAVTSTDVTSDVS